jgi:flagellin-like hook-associated protein FlgL
VASSQIGIGSDAETRANQAKVIDAILNEAITLGNRKFQDLHLFGGDATALPPIVELKGGLRYQGTREGLQTDIGLSRSLAVTLSGEEAFGALSSRVEGNRDLDPTLVPDTRLADVNGARGLGVSLATIEVDVGGTLVDVDLSTAHTVQDVADLVQAAIASVPPNGGTVVDIDPATGNRFRILGNVDPVTITDPATDATAADLGLVGTYPPAVTGADLDPRITERTLLSSLNGVTVPPGTIRLTNIGQTRDLDLSGATTVQDVMNLVEGLDIGIRVEIAETGDRLNFINELSGGAMSVAEVAGGATATELGVRSLTFDTALADFNDGLGVEIRSGSVDPVTGLPDPAADEDFRITLKDGRQFNVDLAGSVFVQDVLDAINAAATTAGVGVPAEFEAHLVADGNGIALTDNTLPAGNPTLVESLNNSRAAEDLGLPVSTTGATVNGADRATVAVDSVFAHLIALRDALETNDERGITLAGGKLDGDITRAAEARADVGVRSRRVTDTVVREEDLQIQDSGLRSQIRDLDFTEAALQFSLLQQQLQAGLATAGQITSLSLLDFLR